MPRRRQQQQQRSPRQQDTRSTRRSSNTNDNVERFARFILSVLVQSYVMSNRSRTRSSDRDSGGPDGAQQSSSSGGRTQQGTANTGELTAQLLREIFQCFSHLYRRRNGLRNGGPIGFDPPQTTIDPRLGERDPYAYLPNGQQLRGPLEDLSRDLQTLYSSVQHAVYSPAPHPNCPLHESMVANADQLQMTITFSLRRINDLLAQSNSGQFEPDPGVGATSRERQPQRQPR